MSYRVEYNGDDIELSTLDSALDSAKNAIAADVGPVSGWTVEHDDTINDWFVQGVVDGSRIGPTAVISGPDPVTPAAPTGRVYTSDDDEDWSRRMSFAGDTPAEAFARAANWLSGRPEVVALSDVGWHSTANGYRLQIYYR